MPEVTSKISNIKTEEPGISQYEEVYRRGIRTGTNVIYRDPETGIKYRYGGVTGKAPKWEDVKDQLIRENTLASTPLRQTKDPLFEEAYRIYAGRGYDRSKKEEAAIEQRNLAQQATREAKAEAKLEAKSKDLTEKQQLQRDVLLKQGYRVQRTEQGDLFATKGGKEVIITKTGKTATAPRGARIEPGFIQSEEKRQVAELREQAKRQGLDVSARPIYEDGQYKGIEYSTTKPEIKRGKQNGVSSRVFSGASDTGSSFDMVSTLSIQESPKGQIDKAIFSQRKRVEELETKKSRGRTTGIERAELFGRGVLYSGLGSVRFIKELITSPISTVKETGAGVLTIGKKLITGEGFPELSQTIKDRPEFSAGFLTSEILQAKGGGIIIKRSAKLGKQVVTVISPKFTPVIDDVIKVGSSSGDIKEIKIGGTVSDLSTPLSEQAKMAGKTTDAVSAQRGIFNRFNTQVKIDKPLPTPDAPPLERSFFADPEARLRPSRLGLIDDQKEASLIDILSGDVKFKAEKPQALLFEDVKIADYPDNLKDVGKKLKQGKALTLTEQRRLVKWQLTKTGEFKPVGFLSKEPEITLAPGEIIIKENKKAITLIRGEPVPIYETRIKQASPETVRLLRKSKLTEPESIELIKRLKQETNIPISSSSRTRPIFPKEKLLSITIPSSRKINLLSSSSLRLVPKSSTISLQPSSSNILRPSSPFLSMPPSKISIVPPSSPSPSLPPSSRPSLPPSSRPIRRKPISSPFPSIISPSRSLSSPIITPKTTDPFFKFIKIQEKRQPRKKKKKKKKLSVSGLYQPQLRSAGEELFGKKAKILTGIGFERPIVRGL